MKMPSLDRLIRFLPSRRRDRPRPSPQKSATGAVSVGLGGGGATFFPVISPFDPHIAFVSCDLGGLYVTKDRGQTWQMIDGREMLGAQQCPVAFDANDGNVVYAFHENRGLRRLDIAAGTWTTLVAAPTPWGNGSNQTVTALSMNGTDVLVGVGTDRTLDPPERAKNATVKGVYKFNPTQAGQSWPSAPVFQGDVIDFVVIPHPNYPGRFVEMVGMRQGVWDLLTWNQVMPPLTGTTWLQGFTAGLDDSDKTNPVIYLYATIGDDTTCQVWWALARIASAIRIPLLGWSQTATQPPLGFSTPHSPPVDHYVRTGRAQGTRVLVAAGEGDARLYDSGDFGKTWHISYEGPKDNDPNKPAITIDGGWVEVEPGVSGGFGGMPRGLGMSNDGFDVLFTNLGGVYRSEGAGLPGCAPLIHALAQFNQQPEIPPASDWQAVYTANEGIDTASGKNQWASNGIDVTTTWNYHVFNAGSQGAPVHFICTTDIGLARSVTSGASWMFAANDAVTGMVGNFYEIAFDAVTNTLYGATSDVHDIPDALLNSKKLGVPKAGALRKSTDGGKTWNVLPLPASFANKPVVSVAYSAPHLFVAVYGDGVYYSADGGSTWSNDGYFQSVGTTNCYRIAIAGAFVYCVVHGDVPATKSGGLFKRALADFPATSGNWTPLTPAGGLDGTGTPYFPVDFGVEPASGDLYLSLVQFDAFKQNIPPGRTRAGIYRAPANTTNWKQESVTPPGNIAGDLRPFGITFDPTDAGAVFAGTLDHGAFRRDPTTGVWTPAFTGVPYLAIHRVAFTPSGTFLTTLGGGVWRA